MTMLEAALGYQKKGYSVFPCGRDKRPLIESWLKYQKEKPSEDQIREWWTQKPGANIAIVTGSISGITVVDCDSDDAIMHFLRTYDPDTYTVKTPKGMHFYYQYREGTRNGAKVLKDTDIRSEGGYVVAPPSVNMEGQAYEIIKDSSALASLPDQCIKDFLSFMHIGDVRNSENSPENASDNSLQSLQILIKGRRDEDLFHIANALIKGHCNPVIAHKSLEILAAACDPPFPERDVEAKIQSAIERAKRKERNLTKEIADWVSLQDGYFFLTDIYTSLQLLTKEEKNNVSQIMHRLEKEKVIEKYGERRGCYRPIKEQYEVLDIANAPDNPLKIELPLNIHEHCRIYPKNVILLSGVANTGKSALAFECTRLNRHLFPDAKVRFQTTEAGDTEIRSKLMLYPQTPGSTMELKWWIENVEFIPRADTWADVINPDGLNIVDYISDYQEAYKVPLYIKQVHDKLRKGIAVLVIQRDPSKPHGQGGQATRHAARLAIDIERNKIVLAKVKSPIRHAAYDHRHPDGLFCNYELVDTWKFIKKGQWRFESEQKYGELPSKAKTEWEETTARRSENDEGGYV